MAQAGIDFTNEMFTGFAGMLPTAADGPQECLLPMALDFRSLIFEGMSLIPSYSTWLLQCDMEPAYRYHERVLKLLQWRCPPDRWWLKTPAHMLSIDALERGVPRRPVRHDPSRRRQGAAVGVRAVRHAVDHPHRTPRPRGHRRPQPSRCGGRALERLIDFRDRGNEDRFHDLSFEAVQRDPIGQVTQLYAELGDDLSDEARTAHAGLVGRELEGPIGSAAATRPRRSDSTRRRSAEQFAFYYDRFDVPVAIATDRSHPDRRAPHEHHLRDRRHRSHRRQRLRSSSSSGATTSARWFATPTRRPRSPPSASSWSRATSPTPTTCSRAAKGCEAAIHTAALLGGASQDLADFQAVNVVGTTNVLDAGRALGMRRVVALSTGTFFDLSQPGPYEEAPVLDDPPDDPVHRHQAGGVPRGPRAGRGRRGRADLPPRRHLRARARWRGGRCTRPASTPILLAAIRGRIPAFLDFPVTWVAAADVASGSIAALDRGVAGDRYWLIGRPEDEISTAAGCNRACELAGVDHRVEDLDYRSDPEALTAAFGPTLMAIAEAAATAGAHAAVGRRTRPTERLGYHPMSLDDGLGLLIPWLRELGKI